VFNNDARVDLTANTQCTIVAPPPPGGCCHGVPAVLRLPLAVHRVLGGRNSRLLRVAGRPAVALPVVGCGPPPARVRQQLW
jgi:hypothetical protein